MGRRPELTGDQVLDIMKDGKRPVWTAKSLAEHADVSRVTANKRLKQLAESERVETMSVGNATAYYIVGIGTQPFGGESDPVERDLRRSLEGRFVGQPYAADLASHVDRHPAKAGDPVEAKVLGHPGDWEIQWVRYAGECDGCDNIYCDPPRESLSESEQSPGAVQALVRGTLEGKPAVPIQYEDFPEDFDVESGIETETYRDNDGDTYLIARGQHWLLEPSNDGVFLSGVEVECVSGVGEGVDRSSPDFESRDLADRLLTSGPLNGDKRYHPSGQKWDLHDQDSETEDWVKEMLNEN